MVLFKAMKKKVLAVLLVALLGAIFIRTFLVDGFIVRGDSMEPAIKDGDYIFINKLAFLNQEPKRGDVVVVTPREKDFKIIKRIVGLPGERFAIEEGALVIRVHRLDEGKVLEEEYLDEKNTQTRTPVLINIDPGEYFALGDNRAVSTDSRELGPIDKWKIKGRVFGILRLSILKYISL